MSLEEVIASLKDPNKHELVLEPGQLLSWLEDYQLLRGEYGANRLSSIEDYRRELARTKAAYYSCNNHCMAAEEHVRRLYKQLDAAKKLLELMDKDFHYMQHYESSWCDKCVNGEDLCSEKDVDSCFVWKYRDEVLKIIGEENKNDDR